MDIPLTNKLVEISMDKHVQETSTRLVTINKLLREIVTFQQAARELLQWCSDARAFQSVFEKHLMECLSTVRHLAPEPGHHDLDLCYRLLAVCSSHKDKFSKQSAALLGQWSEEIGQLLLLRHQQNQSQQGELPTSMQQQMLRKQYSSDGSQMNWPPADASPGQQQHGLSVVTTVWGVTPTSQSNPQISQQHMPTGFNNGGGNMSYSRPPAPAGYPQQPVNSYYRQNSAGPGSGHAHGGPGGTLPHYRPQYNPTNNPDYQPPPGALSAAAMVAAAATATATATATASMIVQEQQQYGGQQPVQHPPHHNGQYPASLRGMQTHQQQPQMQGAMMTSHMPTGGQPAQHIIPGGPGPLPSQGSYRRPAPYPNPHQVAMQRRAQQQQQQQQQQYQQQMGQQMTPHGVQYGAPPSSAYSAQNATSNPHYNAANRPPLSLMMPGGQHMPGQPQPGSYNPRAPPPYGSSPSPYTMRPGTPGMHPHPQQSVHPPTAAQYQNGYGPPHGSAQSPLTPGTQMAPHYPQHPQSYPPQMGSQDTKPDIKPHIQQSQQPGELQLTFPVKDGVVLPPFRLEHNRSVSHHMFSLKEHIYQTLMERPDVELQLKCFYHEDKNQVTNWPASVSISVNDRTLLIEREERRNHKPLYLKDVCVPGKNTITISVCACCCSHLFLLQLVQRPTVRSVLQGLLRKRLLPGEQCISKIKRHFASFNAHGHGDPDAVEQTAVKISLKCPITYRRITLPARGNECRHIECFDLESYLQLNAERGTWKCPFCHTTALLEGLEIDHYMWGILKQLQSNDVEEINIDANAVWKPTKPIHVKEEETLGDNNMCATGVNSSWSKVYSPASTNLPSVGAYEHMHNPMSPYPTPPNSHNSQGGNVTQYSGGVYDVGFNSPPDFTAPLSNRSDLGEDKTADKRNRTGTGGMPPQRQQSELSNPPAVPANSTGHTGPPSNKAPGGPPSNAPPSHGGPPSNLPANGSPSNIVSAGGPPSNAPGSNIPSQGPPSNAPASNQSAAAAAPLSQAELTADINDLINGSNSENLPLEGLDDIDLLSYLGPAGSNGNDNENSQDTADDDILALFAD